MSDFSSIIEKQMNSFFRDKLFDDFVHKELVPLSHLKERHSSWILEIDLPLVNKKNIEITLSDEYLTVKAKLTKTYCISRGSSVTEFDYFKKTIKLPSNIDTKKISAEFKNGILKITIPRLSNGKKISIE
jgi:HSP20 family protein